MREIAPGYGAPGISKARQDLLAALRSALGALCNQDSDAMLFGDAVSVRLTAKSHLAIRPWSAGVDRGYRPTWHLQESQGGLLEDGIDLEPPPSDKLIRRLIGMAIEVLSEVKTVTT